MRQILKFILYVIKKMFLLSMYSMSLDKYNGENFDKWFGENHNE